MKIQPKAESRKPGAKSLRVSYLCPRPSTLDPRPSRAFTLIEIAISLAIIGIALVAIIGVLPWGMDAQRSNREQTIINQDATIFLQAIRDGVNSGYDLTNYVYAITNEIGGGGNINFISNSNIIGLLSTPEYQLVGAFTYTNRMVAYVHSISGSAVEKPPQNNDIVIGDSFSYRLLCEIMPVPAPVPVDIPPLWQAQSYNPGDEVSYVLNGETNVWRASTVTAAADEPSVSPKWAEDLYPDELAHNLYELRLTFLWPILPNGGVGSGHQTYRELIAGQLANNNALYPNTLYFFQPQSFTNAP